MKRIGFIREKEDIKFLILYCMTFLDEPVTMANLADVSMCDGAFGYMEFADATAELVNSGHIKEENLNGTFYYSITYKGKATSDVFEKELPSPVREAARKSVTRVMHNIRRDAAIVTSHEVRSDGTHAVHLAFMDEDVPVFGFEMMVTDEKQGQQYIKNFRSHAETIYKRVVEVLLANYDEPDEFEKTVQSRTASESEVSAND